MGQHTGVPLFDKREPRWYKLLAPKAGEEFKVVLLDNAYTGYATHWIGRTVACDRTPDCPYCAVHAQNRWAGYIPALLLSPRTEAFGLILTPGLARQLHALEVSHGNLRGLMIFVQRVSLQPGQEPANNSPLEARFNLRRSESQTPPVFDLRYSVQRLYKINDKAFAKMRATDRNDYILGREEVFRHGAGQDDIPS